MTNKKVQKDDKWYVYSDDGKKKLGGPDDTEAEADERLAQVEHFKKAKNQFMRVLFNTKPKLVRNERMADKDYLVVPMVMLTEGVHVGSEGPYYYPKHENQKRVELWNKKPIVVYHPDGPTACTPEVLNVRWIGDIMNAKATSKGEIKAEAWLDEDRVKKVDKRILDAIKNEETLELSTGLFADSDEEPGEWNGEEFNGTLRNYGPDHLAILPDQVGACSVEDGAGFYRNAEGKKEKVPEDWQKWTTAHFNELSVNDLTSQLQKLIAVKGEYRWVENVFPDEGYFIYSVDGGGLHKQGYKKDSKDNVTLDGVPEAVVRVVSYKPVKNETKPMQNQSKESPDMDKKKIVDELIVNKRFEEKHRDTLMGMPEDMLEHLAKPLQNAEPAPKPTEPVASVAAPVQNAQPSKPKNIEEYLNDLPVEVRNSVRRSMERDKAEKARLIGVITKHPKNTFTKEYLETKDIEELTNLANLAVTNEDQQREVANVQRFNYAGQGFEPIQNDDCSDVPTLTPPTYENVGKKTVAA
jgi:hypothetical protein